MQGKHTVLPQRSSFLVFLDSVPGLRSKVDLQAPHGRKAELPRAGSGCCCGDDAVVNAFLAS
jgi:hypothetical protein